MKHALDPPSRVEIWCGPQGDRSMDSDRLVPGDVLEIPPSVSSPSSSGSGQPGGSKNKETATAGWKVPADAVLVSGACIVNESSLSGALPLAFLALCLSATCFMLPLDSFILVTSHWSSVLWARTSVRPFSLITRPDSLATTATSVIRFDL